MTVGRKIEKESKLRTIIECRHDLMKNMTVQTLTVSLEYCVRCDTCEVAIVAWRISYSKLIATSEGAAKSDIYKFMLLKSAQLIFSFDFKTYSFEKLERDKLAYRDFPVNRAKLSRPRTDFSM